MARQYTPLAAGQAPARRVGAPRLRHVLQAALLALGVGSAQAGLFDDEEARKAILDLRSRISANEEAARARVTELVQANAQLTDQVQQLRRALLDVNAQLEAQRAESAKLRGSQEQLGRDLAETQRRLKDASVALDERLRAFEPQKVTVDGQEFLVDPAEKRQHDQAMAHLRTADFDRAAPALAAFAQRYPSSGYLDSVRFWLGNAQYGQKNYKDAIVSFRALVVSNPSHPRAPEAMLALANCQAEMKDTRAARRTLEELLKAYPSSDAAGAAKERLATLKP